MNTISTTYSITLDPHFTSWQYNGQIQETDMKAVIVNHGMNDPSELTGETPAWAGGKCSLHFQKRSPI